MKRPVLKLLACLFILAVCGGWSSLKKSREYYLKIALREIVEAEQKYFAENNHYTYNLIELGPFGWDVNRNGHVAVGFPDRCVNSSDAFPNTLRLHEGDTFPVKPDIRINKSLLERRMDQYGVCPEDQKTFTAVAVMNWMPMHEYVVVTAGPDGKPIKREPKPSVVSDEYWSEQIGNLPDHFHTPIHIGLDCFKLLLWYALFFGVNVLGVKYEGRRTLKWAAGVTFAQGILTPAVGIPVWIGSEYIVSYLDKSSEAYDVFASLISWIGIVCAVQIAGLVYVFMRRYSHEARWRFGDLWMYLSLSGLVGLWVWAFWKDFVLA